MEMCGRIWARARDATKCRAGGPFPVNFLAFFRTVLPRPFPVPCLTVSFFLSCFLFFCVTFWDWEVSVSFSCLTSLFVCARARAFLFCSGWLLDFPAPPFPPLNMSSLRKIQKHDECWLQGDFFVRCTVWRNESATLTQLCQNTSVRRFQVCFRGGSAAGGQQANSSESIPRRWRMRSWNPRSRMKTTRSSTTSLPIWKVTSS